ncbi:unnamed protein product [Trichobilharzia regenti]|nr:unnamed protein product [Trichobilharzia regenti]
MLRRELAEVRIHGPLDRGSMGPSRDRMQNAFIKRTQGGGIASSKSTVESEKMKREFLSQYCLDFGQRTQQASLRAQIIETYSSILIILKSVPTVSYVHSGLFSFLV